MHPTESSNTPPPPAAYTSPVAVRPCSAAAAPAVHQGPVVACCQAPPLLQPPALPVLLHPVLLLPSAVQTMSGLGPEHPDSLPAKHVRPPAVVGTLQAAAQALLCVAPVWAGVKGQAQHVGTISSSILFQRHPLTCRPRCYRISYRTSFQTYIK